MARTKSIGEWIRSNREKNGLSQTALALSLGYSTAATVSQWENERTKPNSLALAELEKRFGSFNEQATTEPDQGFSNWLRTARTEKGMTLMQLSALSKVNISTISQIENGKIESPSASVYGKLTDALRTKGTSKPADMPRPTSVAGIGDFQEFNPYAEEELPKVPGIYVFYDISERPIYVGEAADIRRRIKQHSDAFWFKSPIVETAAFIEVDDEELRGRLEVVLIKFMKSNAVINKQHVKR